jgi:hypothetical protein
MDLPIYENGDLGSDIPTFQTVDEGFIKKWIRPASEANQARNSLKAIGEISPKFEYRVMSNIVEKLNSREFAELRFRFAKYQYDPKIDMGSLRRDFRNALITFWRNPNFLNAKANPQRVRQFNDVWAVAFEEVFKEFMAHPSSFD